MTRKEMIELVKKLQAEGEQCHNCQLELYITVEGELRTQLMTGPHEYRNGFFLLAAFQGKDSRNPSDMVDSIPMWDLPDGFPEMKEWYLGGDL